MKRYDCFLARYPRRFRERFGDGMRAALKEDYRRARSRGRLATFWFVTTTILRAIVFAVVERLPRAARVRPFVSVDVRDAFRSLSATPIVTAVAIVSLALGIGANAALFSILNSLVIRELPVREPEQLVTIGGTDWTNPIWEQIRDRQTDLFESACAWSYERFNLAEAGRTDPVGGGYVSGGLFHTLGVGTVVGRPLTPADDQRGGGAEGHVAVISYGFWQQRFGGAQNVLGRQITVNRVPFAIVGVTPPGFQGPEVGQAMDVFLPLAAEGAIRGRDSALDGRSSSWLRVMARLEPNQTIEAATAALNAIRPAIREATIPANLSAEYRATYLTDRMELVAASTGVSSLRNQFEQPLTIILIVVAAVLLIACVNIASLMLARATARRHEMSVRLALGASRARLGRQVLTESFLLALAGGAAGLAVAKAGAALLVGQLGSQVSLVTLDLSIDWRVMAFTAGLALGATFLFGLAPAFGLGKIEPNDALKEQSRGISGERSLAVRNVLVIVQVALSFVLVAGAGVFVRTFMTLTTTALGFEPSQLLIVNVDAGGEQFTSREHVALTQRVAEAAARVSGVSRASVSYLTPMSGRNWTQRVQVSGGPALARAEQVTTVNAIAPGWFETYGMRRLSGRDVAGSDTVGAERVAVVNQAFVRRFLGNQNPLGHRITGLGLGTLKECVIVGVVNDAVYRTARGGIVPTMYLPMAQANAFGSTFSVTAKLISGRSSVERSLSEAIASVGPQLTFSLRDYADQVRATVVQERLVAMLSGFFGMLATLLAALGLYGVTSYSVSRRRSEIAVRMALGASSRLVLGFVLRQVAMLLVAGAALGVGLSLWTSRFVAALLFGVDARDPLTLAATGTMLVALGMFAGWLPARNASRQDPSAALRTGR
jgi:putative ABC transport system permease protein